MHVFSNEFHYQKVINAENLKCENRSENQEKGEGVLSKYLPCKLRK